MLMSMHRYVFFSLIRTAAKKFQFTCSKVDAKNETYLSCLSSNIKNKMSPETIFIQKWLQNLNWWLSKFPAFSDVKRLYIVCSQTRRFWWPIFLNCFYNRLALIFNVPLINVYKPCRIDACMQSFLALFTWNMDQIDCSTLQKFVLLISNCIILLCK